MPLQSRTSANLIAYLIPIVFLLTSCDLCNLLPYEPESTDNITTSSRPKGRNIINTNQEKIFTTKIKSLKVEPSCPTTEGASYVSIYQKYLNKLNKRAIKQVSRLTNNCLDFSSECMEEDSTTIFTFSLDNPNCQFYLGNQFKEKTELLPKDSPLIEMHLQLAFICYQSAALQNHVQAQTDLGEMYELGWGVSIDYKEALKWYKKAALQGYAKAQANLGSMYENGTGVSENSKKALKWYKKAADQEYAEAQYLLGDMYARGWGEDSEGTANPHEAKIWIEKAAMQGHAEAQSSLALIYEYGTGVNKDMEQAKFWYKKSASQGYKYAVNKIEYLNSTSNQIKQNTTKASKTSTRTTKNKNKKKKKRNLHTGV